MFAKVSTAATFIIGPILDSTGAEYTSAVIGDISLSKNGATLTALASAATLTHIANGQYTLVTTTGNMDTIGRAQFTCNKSTYQMPPLNVDVLPATSYDTLVTNGTLASTTSGRTVVTDSNGLVDANAVKGGPSGSGVALSAALITNLKVIYDTDYATVYDTTNKAFLAKLGNFAMGGSSLALTTGAISGTTLTFSGAVAFQSTFAVTTSTSLAALSCTTLTASGAVAFQSTFAVTTSTSLAALSCTTLTASGAVAFQSTLAVTGATTLTGNVAMAAGLNITQSSANTSALVVTGTGTGHGAIFTSGSGATGDGVKVVSGATNGNGLNLVSAGTGSGLLTDKLTASGAVAFQSTLAVTTSTSLGALSATTITASGAVAFQSTFAVTTSTSLGALSATTITASGAVAFQSTFAVTTSTSLAALSCTTLTASGAVAFQSTFAVTTSTSLAALSATTITASGSVALQSTLVVTGATTLTGAITATNASNSIVGVVLGSTAFDAVLIESSITAGADLTNDAGTQLTSINARQALSLITSAAAAGVLAGAATTTITTKPAGLPAGNTRVTGTVDSSGNRTAITLKVPT